MKADDGSQMYHAKTWCNVMIRQSVSEFQEASMQKSVGIVVQALQSPSSQLGNQTWHDHLSCTGSGIRKDEKDNVMNS